MQVTSSGNGRVWIESAAGDRFGFEFTTRAAEMTEMLGEPDWVSARTPAEAAALIADAQRAAVDFARREGWID